MYLLAKPAAYRWSDEKSRHLLFFANINRERLYPLPHLMPALNAFSNIDIIFTPHRHCILRLTGRTFRAIKRLRIAIVLPYSNSSQPSNWRRSCCSLKNLLQLASGLSGARNLPCRFMLRISSQHYSHIQPTKMQLRALRLMRMHAPALTPEFYVPIPARWKTFHGKTA